MKRFVQSFLLILVLAPAVLTAQRSNTNAGGGAVSIANGADITKGSKTDARSTATDGTSVSIMSVLKEISYMLQNPAGGGSAVTIADGGSVTLGAKADAKSTATDTTAITAMQVLKEMSFMLQNPASRAVTNAGTFATQSAITAALNSLADGSNVTLGAKADAKSTASDTTAVTIMQVLKEISFMEQTPASRAVTNAGTFAAQVTAALNALADGALVTLGAKADAKSTATDTTAVTAMQVLKEISFMLQNPAALPAGSALIGEIVSMASATTTDSTLECSVVSAASTNSTSCKGSSGNLYGIELTNSTATIYYLRLYNSASAPTCSSATGFIRSVMIPANVSGAGIFFPYTPPVGYSTGIGYCLTGGSSSTDNTNAAVGVLGALRYK